MEGSATGKRAGRPPDVTLKIPRPLYDRLSLVIEDTGFRSVTEFCVYVLRDLVSASETPHAPTPPTEEIDAVKQRLRALGYLED